jgi:hypothetical protein
VASLDLPTSGIGITSIHLQITDNKQASKHYDGNNDNDVVMLYIARRLGISVLTLIMTGMRTTYTGY